MKRRNKIKQKLDKNYVGNSIMQAREESSKNMPNIFSKTREYIDNITFIRDTVYMEMEKNTYEEAYEKKSLGN